MQQLNSLRKIIARLLLGVLLLLHIGYALHTAMHLECGATTDIETTHSDGDSSSDATHCVLCDLGLLPILSSVERPLLLGAVMALLATLGIEELHRVSTTARAYTSLRAPPVL